MRTTLSLCLLVSVLLPRVASAQEGTLNRYRPSPVITDDWHLSRPTDHGHLRISAQLHLDYANDPLVYEMVAGDRDSESLSVVEHQLNATAGFAIGIIDRLVIYAGLPVTLVMNGADAAEVMPLGAAPADGAGLGDLYLGVRARILGEAQDTFGLGAQLTATFPTSGSDYRGDPFLTVHPQLLAELRPLEDTRGFRLVFNVGALFREGTGGTASNLEFGNELTFGFGANYPVWIAEDDPNMHVDVNAQLYGSSTFALIGEEKATAFEGTIGARLFHSNGLVAGVGGGLGLARGFGSPDARILALIGWGTPAPGEVGDRDQDGLRDDVDECPDEPEDMDGFEDGNGCPDPDNDGDGILDGPDECPNEPETVNEVDDADGCPDEVGDQDGDGIMDPQDECPTDPEDVDEFEDENGCPDPDNDGDGVLDDPDRCPMEAGPVENHGCPDTDRDEDTVVDRHDNCPDEPGPVENHGCREEQQAVVTDTGIDILDHVYFRTNRATILRRSHPLLRNVAQVLNNHPEIERIRVEGHTDTRGNDDANMTLSQERAEAVVEFLVENGVDRGRLHAVGFGETRPVVEDASSRADHARNRRVEFNLEHEGVETRASGPSADAID